MMIALLCAITGKYYLHNQSLNKLLFRSSETNQNGNAKGPVFAKLKRHLRHNKDEPMKKLAPNRRTNNTLHNDPDANHICSPISFTAQSTCLYELIPKPLIIPIHSVVVTDFISLRSILVM